MSDMRDWRRAIDEMFSDEFHPDAANRPADGEYELCPVCHGEDEDCPKCGGEGLIDITGEYEIPDFSKMQMEGTTLDRFYQDDTLYDTVAPLIDYLELNVNENLYIYETFGAFDIYDNKMIEHRGENIYYDGAEDVYFALTANHKYLISPEKADSLSIDKDMRYVGRTTVGMLTPETMVSERNDHAKIKLTPKDLSDPDDDGMIDRPESEKDVKKHLKKVADRYNVEFVDDFAKYTKKSAVKEDVEDELVRMLRLAGMMVKPEKYDLPCCDDEDANEEGEESVFTNTSDFVDEIRGEPPQDHETFDNPFGDESVLTDSVEEAVGDLEKLSDTLPKAIDKTGLPWLANKVGDKISGVRREWEWQEKADKEQRKRDKKGRYNLRDEDLDTVADDIIRAYSEKQGNAPSLSTEKAYEKELSRTWLKQIYKTPKYSRFNKPTDEQIKELAKIMLDKTKNMKEDRNMDEKFDWDSVLEQENKWRRIEHRDLAEDEVEEDFLADPEEVEHGPEEDEVEEMAEDANTSVLVNNEEVYYALADEYTDRLNFGNGKNEVVIPASQEEVRQVMNMNGFREGTDYELDSYFGEDLQNGYDDRREHDADDFFPTGAVSNASKAHGPEAAKHGGNPMATKMRTNESADVYEKLKQEYRRHRLK
jgi:hypothetical protein